ncbi:MAG: 5-formyltetrahydrofolate cyclo-ligase [Thermoplasmata archaeon]
MEIRNRIWNRLETEGVARFPWPAKGRIPNFDGSREAAEELSELDVWADARAIKTNPDSPQRWARRLALLAGKVLYMAVPRLTQVEAFVELDPRRLDSPERAATIKGALALGKPVHPKRVPPIDLVLTGSVAVDSQGGRLGKGGGYSDLEYALGRTFGFVQEATPIATTVHPLQLVRGAIPMLQHDIPVDFVAFPDQVIPTKSTHIRPEGIDWDLLPEAKVKAIPSLRGLAEREPASGGT